MVFTGIVEGTGLVTKVDSSKNLTKISIQMPVDFSNGIRIGASVCVDGVCLTVSSISVNELSFDVIIETLNVTTFNEIKINDVVNVERSMKLGDEIGGHILSGHVSTTAVISEIDNPENNHVIKFSTDLETIRYIFPKGYIALNGVSLTVGDVDKSNKTFNVYLIPETLRLTNLGSKKVGDKINLEIETQTRNMVDTISEINKESIHG
ncbi:MAG TPA: riboflavin synthase subunit alpha [Candidatus Poseidoniia archaeon]|jgi:riboflavin synthase|nr:riboflavin synthase subunit alpha [Candidatus Poseidoniia archaeon]|tara:strand:- start:570 stop:1193 length:624 start_codon:yes stop_codon:yes gene_type:complete